MVNFYSIAINTLMFLNNYQYITFSYICITSIYVALSICVLFISLMQSINRAHILNTTSLMLLSGSIIADSGTGVTYIVPLT